MIRRGRTRVVRVPMRITAAAVAAVGVAGGIWWHWLNAVPDVHIPPPMPLPSPNGYDMLVRAGSRIRETDAMLAATSMRRGADAPPLSEAALARDIAANRDALDLARQSLRVPSVYPARAHDYYDFAGIRKVGRSLSSAAFLEEMRGDIPGAVQIRLDLMEIGADRLPRGGSAITGLVSQVIEAMGRNRLWGAIDRLNAADARAAALRVEQIDRERVPIADALTETKWEDEQLQLTEFRSHNNVQIASRTLSQLRFYQAFADGITGAFQGTMATPPSAAERITDTAQGWWQMRSLLTHSKKQILSDYVSAMDALAARTRDRYRPGATLPPAGDTLNQILLPIYETADCRERNDEMMNRLLATALALRAYDLEHGGYPAALTDLTAGGYLTNFPADPFDPSGGPLRYRRLSGDRYLLYSVGPDGKNDDGRPIMATWHGREVPVGAVDPGMTGDFVVGPNTSGYVR